MKLCPICNKNDRQTIFGKDTRCLSCNRKRRKEFYKNNTERGREISLSYYHRNRDASLKRMKDYNERLKDEVFTFYGGYTCKCCGETERKFLTIDHIDGGGNDHRRSEMGGGTYICRWIKKNNFPSLFQVLCYNCNLGKSRNNNICPHQEKK